MVKNLSYNSNTFSSLLNSVNVSAKSNLSTKKQAEKPSDSKIASVQIKDVQNEKKGYKGLIGLSIGATVLAGIAAVFVLTKGVSGGFYKKIANFSEELKKRAYDLTVNVQNPTTFQKIKLSFAKIVQPLLDSFQSISNINVIKDGGIMLIAKWLKLTPVVDKINSVFKGIVLKTQRNSYNDAEYAVIKFTNCIENIAKSSKNSELMNLASSMRDKYQEVFSTNAHYNRSENFWKSIKLLHGRVWNTLLQTRKHKNLNQYKSYITLEQTADKRNKIYKELISAKKSITNGIEDNYRALKEELKHIKVNVKTKDEKAVDYVQRLSKEFEIYKKLNGTNEAKERAQVSRTVEETLDAMLEYLGCNPNFSDVNAAANNIRKILNTDFGKKGMAQEVITQIKQIYGKQSSEYKMLTSQLDSMNSKLNQAIETEMNAYEKMAELRVGSAPTDIVGILTPAAIGTALVMNAKTKEEKVSKTLTQGIPILGGIATAYYGTTRMFTGPKNMALGLITAYVLNILGTQVDNFYKSYKEKQSLFKTTMASLKAYQEKYKEV